ncbi:MAG: hypothetical protein WCR63_04925 [Bacilli bacterium]
MAQLQGLILILSNVEKLNPLLKTLVANNIHGCTIWDSEGMTHRLLEAEDEEISHFGSIRKIVNPDRDRSKTLFFVGTKEEVERAKKLIVAVIGDFNQPDTGVMFVININESYGIPDID